MNERIKELAEEAGFLDAWFSESGDDCQQEIYRLVALVVEDCVTMCEGLGAYYANARKDELEFAEKNIFAQGETAALSLKREMKKHFGIK